VSDLRRSLQELLSERQEAAVDRERTAFDRQAGSLAKGLVLFGAGHLGRKTLSGLRKAGLEPAAFADNDTSLWGKDVSGIPVLSLPDAARRHAEAVVIVTIWRGEGTDRMRERLAQARAAGFERVIAFLPLFWKHHEIFLPHYAVDLPHRVVEQRDRVLAGFDLLSDEASRREFLGEVRWRLLGDFDDLGEPVATEIYFPEDLKRFSPEEEFVDCGAFDGDTLRRFFARVPGFAGRVTAFEPDPRNFEKLRAYSQTLSPDLRARIDIHPYAVGRERGTVRFNATGNEAAAVGFGNAEVQAVTLDEMLSRGRPTYIKMDTEGSEIDALAGAAQTIARARPALAVCVYHQQNHLWEIPLRIASTAKGYRQYLRPQLLEGWDLVCYAIPGD
jgi:FkbM family methyltransferase